LLSIRGSWAADGDANVTANSNIKELVIWRMLTGHSFRDLLRNRLNSAEFSSRKVEAGEESIIDALTIVDKPALRNINGEILATNSKATKR
jgi:hypothetical protein